MKKKYRTQFDLGLSDLEMIEDALRNQVKQLSLDKLDQLHQDGQTAKPNQPDPRLLAIQSVLGKLHNQKIWYTPAQYVPRG